MSRCGLVLVVAVTACGPSLGGLVADHHYREAICGAHDGSSRDRASVGAALHADAGTAIHVHMITAAELAPLLGDATGAVTARARFAQISAQTNILPVDGVDLEIAVTDATHPVGTVASWASLARITNEPLPPQQAVTTYATGGNVLRGLAALFTVGLSLPFTQFTPGVTMVDAPDDEYRRLAPLAHALVGAMASRCSNPAISADTGARCSWFFVIVPEGRARLEVSVRYTANRKTKHGGTSTKRCAIVETTTVDLGNLDELDHRFGTRWRRLFELTPR